MLKQGTIKKLHYGTPRIGMITVEMIGGALFEASARAKVKVLRLAE